MATKTTKTPQQYEEEIAELKRILRMNCVQLCPICGGRMNRSTKWEKYYCAQDYGLCGEWWLSLKSSKVASYFSKTTIVEGRLDISDVMYTRQRHYFFAAGKEVSKQRFIEMSGLGRTPHRWEEQNGS